MNEVGIIGVLIFLIVLVVVGIIARGEKDKFIAGRNLYIENQKRSCADTQTDSIVRNKK